jgi:cytochrome P450
MLLSKHPEVVQKLREEHNQVFGADFDATVRLMVESPEKLPDLEYTTCVLKEAMRLFPIGFGVREAPKG